MSRLTQFALKWPALAVVLTLGLLLAGLNAATGIQQELTPPVEPPQATILTVWPGASADEITESVVKPIEDALEGITDIEVLETSSLASDSFSAISVLSEFGTDQSEIEEAIEEAIADVDLPDDAEDPEVLLFSFSDIPVLQASVRGADGDLPTDVLQRIVEEEILPEIESIEGVSEVNLLGGSEEKIFLNLDRDVMQALGIKVSGIEGAINSNDLSFPAGNLEVDGKTKPLQVVYRINDLDDLEDLRVGSGGGGPPGAGGPPPGAGGPPAASNSGSSNRSSNNNNDSASDDDDASADEDDDEDSDSDLEINDDGLLVLDLPQAAVDLGFETTADLTASAIQQLELLQPDTLDEIAEDLINKVPAGGPSPVSDEVFDALPRNVRDDLQDVLDAEPEEDAGRQCRQ